MKIPEEILQVDKHLTNLLEKYLDDKLDEKKRNKIYENKNKNGRKL
jgi:hypothetical protein